MNIRPVNPAPAFATAASKETSEEERRQGQERGRRTKKKTTEGFKLKDEPNADAPTGPEEPPHQEIPGSEKVIELLSHRANPPSPQNQRAFSNAAKSRKPATPFPESKLDKKY